MVLACAGAIAACAPQPARVEVGIRGLEFEPGSMTFAAGDTLVWTNHDIVPHTVTAESGDWDSGEIAVGESFLIVVDETHVGEYLCRYHPGMKGALNIR